jgi:hypothetical protein
MLFDNMATLLQIGAWGRYHHVDADGGQEGDCNHLGAGVRDTQGECTSCVISYRVILQTSVEKRRRTGCPDTRAPTQTYKQKNP